MKKFSDNISTGEGADSTPTKPGAFSAGIVEGQDKAPETRKLKAFSDDISTGAGAEAPKEVPAEEMQEGQRLLKVDTSLLGTPAFKFSSAKRAELKKLSLFTDIKIDALERLGQRPPKSGYKRYTKLENVLSFKRKEGPSAWSIIGAMGFVDITPAGDIDKSFHLYEERMTEELRSFSDDITSGALEEMQEQPLKVDTSNLGTKAFKYSASKIAELRMKGKGFSDATIRAIEKLGQKPPEESYTRTTNQRDVTKWADAWCIIGIWGFVDIDKSGMIHDTLPFMPLPHSEMAEVSIKGLGTTSFKYPSSKMNALRQQGFKDSEIKAIEKLGQEKTPLGHERFTDTKNFNEGTDAWHMVTTWGFVDIDRGGFIHRVFPLYSEDFQEWHPYTQGVKNAKAKGFTEKDVEEAFKAWMKSKTLTEQMKNVLKAAWPQFFNKGDYPSPYKKDYPYPTKKQEPNIRVPQGENYSPKVGWY